MDMPESNLMTWISQFPAGLQKTLSFAGIVVQHDYGKS